MNSPTSPKILHQVWVQGEANLPVEYAANRVAWRDALPAGWEMRLWDNSAAREQWPDYAEQEERCFHHATRCDLILARALRDFGGLACGTDVRPNNMPALMRFCEATPAFIVTNIKGGSCSNGLQWFAAPGNGFISCVARHQLRNKGAVLPSKDVWRATGPGCYWDAMSRYHWPVVMIPDNLAYTVYGGGQNPDAFVHPGYAGSWH